MKYVGKIGFEMQVETDPGIWVSRVEERTYFGDVIRNTRRYSDGDKMHDDLRISNQISVLADSFCIEYIFCMKYITWMNQRFKVDSADINYPRVIITLGGVWHGDDVSETTPEAPDSFGGTTRV